MSTTTYWSPNQASIAQEETVTLVGAPSTGNTFSATINGKTVTYVAISSDTLATFVTGLFNLLNQSVNVPAEMNEITFSNPSAGVITATAQVPGTPFANVPGTNAGLVFSTGNGYSGTCTQVHTIPNASPSDVLDPQNWLRVNLTPTPPTRTWAIPVSGDDVVVGASSVPMLWNLDQLAGVQFNTYNRYQSMTGQLGLDDTNANGYQEWRATRFKFLGPQGSVPAGGLQMVTGADVDGLGGSGPAFERYDLQSSQYTLTAIDGNVDIIGQHTANTFTALPGSSVLVAPNIGTKSNLSSSAVHPGATAVIGLSVTWTAGSTLQVFGGSAVLNSAPATVDMRSGAQVTVATDQLTWATITAQGGCTLTFLAGGTITALTMSQSCTLDKSQDARQLVITNSTIDGDTCQILDPLNSIVFTNATTVKQQVQSGPIQFTGTRTVKVT
jgi:hypothetical protein